MTKGEYPIVVGVFEDTTEAKSAIHELRNAGFSDEQIGIAMHERELVAYRTLDSFINMGMPVEIVNYFKREFEVGHDIVSVRHNGRRRDAFNVLYGNRLQELLSRSIPTMKLVIHNNLEDQDCSPQEGLTTPDNLPSWWKLLKDAGLDYLI